MGLFRSLPTNCPREASRRHLLGLGARLGGQSQQSDFHLLKLLFVHVRLNRLGLARGGELQQPKPRLFVRAAKSPWRCGAGQSLRTARPASALRSCGHGTVADMVPKQRWVSLCQQGHPAHPNISTRSGTASPRCLQPDVRGALRGLRPSHLTQAPAAFIPGQDAGSQRVLSSQPEQKAQRGAGSTESHQAHGPRGARGRAPCRTPVADSGRWGLGWSRAGAAQEVEEHFRTPLGHGEGVTTTLGAPRAAQNTELDGAGEAGLDEALGPTLVKLFLHGSCWLWCSGSSYRYRESQASFSLSREAEPRDHH